MAELLVHNLEWHKCFDFLTFPGNLLIARSANQEIYKLVIKLQEDKIYYRNIVKDPFTEEFKLEMFLSALLNHLFEHPIYATNGVTYKRVLLKTPVYKEVPLLSYLCRTKLKKFQEKLKHPLVPLFVEKQLESKTSSYF